MATEYQDITVHAVSFAHNGGPVFYASLPDAGQPRHDCRAKKAEDKIRLISILLDHVGAREDSLWSNQPLFNGTAHPIRLTHGPLGRPHLLLGNVRGPAISFSLGGGKAWAALCRDGFIGIDAAAGDEFQGDYPLHRVFLDQELHHAVRLAGGDVAKASALLWSIKEAVVKALGCGFHFVAPRDVYVSPAVEGDRGTLFPVHLSAKVLARFSSVAGQCIWVRSYPLAQMWFSVAFWHG